MNESTISNEQQDDSHINEPVFEDTNDSKLGDIKGAHQDIDQIAQLEQPEES
jgi:hypothetical protein